jgi:hypothetical protein
MTVNARMCQQFYETVCPALAKEEYIKYHDMGSTQLHFNICKQTEVKVEKNKWYKHIPNTTESNQDNEVSILWNYQIMTDRTIPCNEADITLQDRKGTCVLSFLYQLTNVLKMEAEKILKYKKFLTEK